MIRILHVVGGMDRGGIETFLMTIYRNIDRNKIQFDFMVHTDKECAYDEEIRNLGGRIYPVIPRKQGIFKNIKSLDNFFKTHKEYKIIHQHMSSLTYIEPLKIAKKYGIPCRITHSHNIRQGGSPIHKYIHMINKITLESYATEYFACSYLAAKWMYTKKIYEENRFRVINNAIESKKFIFNETIRNKKREELKIKDKFVIGHIGRFHPQKNHDFLIDIFKEIYDKDENSILLLIGDGQLKTQIENKVKNLKLSNNVIFTGVCDDIPKIIQAMDVFLLPSLYEGLGIVLVEAQASGLKCFTSDKVVPQDVDSTGLVKFINLDKSARHWAKEVLKGKDYERQNTMESIIDGGYDVFQVANEIQNWYQL